MKFGVEALGSIKNGVYTTFGVITTGRLPAFPAVVFVGAHSALSSVWDAAKLICLNRVHRIPIVQLEETTLPDLPRRSQGDLLYILSLKTVFTETVLKLSDPKLSLGPHVKRTLADRKVGTWSQLFTIPQAASCSDAIALFLDKKISSVPVVDSLNRVLGVISKSDIMSELVRHPNNYLEILDIPVVDLIANIGPCPLGTTTMTVYEIISTLVNTDRQSLVVVDVEKKPLAVVSYSDLMDYIQNCSDAHHKLSLA